jgi:hypothetical protein
MPPHRCGFPRVPVPKELKTLKMRAAAVAALMIPMAILGGCSRPGQSTSSGAEQGKFAGLDGQILSWRKAIIASDPLCKSQAEGEKCEGFEVACKAERTVTADDQAKGITARVVTVITWTGFDAKFKHAQNGSRAAEFAKGASGWTRADHAPVNMSTCADL